MENQTENNWYAPLETQKPGSTQKKKGRLSSGWKVFLGVFALVLLIAGSSLAFSSGKDSGVTIPGGGKLPEADSELPENWKDYFESYFLPEESSKNEIRLPKTENAQSFELKLETALEQELSLQELYQKCAPSIVAISGYMDKRAGYYWGSGIILSEDGYIATNAHVVENTSRYSVKLFDDSQSDVEYNAVLVGHDTKTDLAVLKISAGKLKPAALGNSDDVHLGEEVCALGNPAGLSGSITTGIISGMNRKVRAKSTNFEMDCFQTDAAISPGNSGGALVDMYGKVIGITSSKYGSSFILGGSYEGLGFAITINQALPIIQELMEKGYVSGRVRIGIQFLDNVNAHAEAEKDKVTLPKELDGHGIQVVSISQDSDLKNTVMEDGDWILTMNGTEVSDYDSINQAISGLVGGDSVHCRCGRVQDDGTLKTFEIDFTLIEDQSGEY